MARNISRILFQLGCLCCLAVASRATPIVPPANAATPSSHQPERADAFLLPDVGGTRRSLADYRGHTVALFFFCGCDLCHQCARQWRQILASGQLEKAMGTKPVSGAVTLIVFGGDADGAKNFARQTGLDATGAVFLPDPLEIVSDLYVVDSCPRIFVIDANGLIRYTNDGKNTDRSIDLLVSRAVDAVRACESSSKPAKEPHGKN